MALPNFLIIGAQKSGTSWLAHNLRQHPDVFMPEREIHFFDKDYNFKKGIKWYEKHFADSRSEKAIGEKTPDYLWANGIGVEGHLPDVHKNIFEILPMCKLIVVLRNPVERAISAVKHIIRSGRIAPWHNIEDLLFGNKQHLIEGHGVLDYGDYYRQIDDFLKFFNYDQTLILIYEEDIVNNPAEGIAKTCEFLGIDKTFEFAGLDKKRNENRVSWPRVVIGYYVPSLNKILSRFDRYLPIYKIRPSKEVVHKLYEYYKDKNERFFEMIGRRVEAWGNQ